jgi:HD-GYP domain-containing protein (c-di-GMP phosphodiesterase class II)
MIRFAEILESDPKLEVRKHVGLGELSLKKAGLLHDAHVIDKETLNEARNHHQNLITLAHQVQRWVHSNTTIDVTMIEPVLGKIIKTELIDGLYHRVILAGAEEDRLVSQSIAVTAVSLKVGRGLKYDNKRLADLGLAAFLQDVGMYQVSRSVLDKSGKLSKQEWSEIQSHPEMSAEILSRSGDKYMWLADVARQVHERADGSGYPLGLKDDGIYEYAYIIGLADMYSAMIADRPYRGRIEPNKAMRDIIELSKGSFPCRVTKEFVNQISFFPLNSRVKLNDRSVGRVVNTDPDFPLKPTVKIMRDSLGNGVRETRIVDLSKQILLYITGSIDGKDNT